MICKIMSEEVVEQITRDPPKEEQKNGGNNSKKRDKDPKKVAAGKKLAEYNKKAKEALARETLRTAEQMKLEEENENIVSESKAWFPELSFTTVLSIVGIGFTAFDMFMRYRQIHREDDKNTNEERILTQPSQPPQPTTLKMGMI